MWYPDHAVWPRPPWCCPEFVTEGNICIYIYIFRQFSFSNFHLLRYFECEQLLNFCVVSKVLNWNFMYNLYRHKIFFFVEDWRCMINSCYLWRKVADTLGLRDLKHCNIDPDTDNNGLCRCGQSLNRKIRCRKNFRNGKYTKGWFSNFLNWRIGLNRTE